MAKFLTGSICLSDIAKEKVTTSEKNGKKYLNVVLYINDQEDKYGNIASLQVGQTKEERERNEKKVYIGNFKESNKQLSPVQKEDDSSSLPF